MMEEKYYFLTNKNLPKKGWLQSCVNCYTITSKVFFLKHSENTDYYFFMCYECKRKNLNNNLEFINHIQNNITPLSIE